MFLDSWMQELERTPGFMKISFSSLQRHQLRRYYETKLPWKEDHVPYFLQTRPRQRPDLSAQQQN